MLRYLPMVVRILLGAIFFVFGLNAFLQFIPMPSTPAPKVVPFMNGLMAAGYFFPFLKVTEITCGLLLLINRFVPLALVILAPIVLNIAAVHYLLDPSGAIMATFILLSLAYLGWAYRPYFRGVLSAKAEPVTGASANSTHRVPAEASY